MARRPRKDQRPKTNVGVPPGSMDSALGLQFRPSTLAGLSVLLAPLALLLYFPASGHPFINYDDGPYITDNPHIQNGVTLQTVRWALTSIYAANWHPLTWLLHALNLELFGQNAGEHHLVSMVFHAANVVLLFVLLAVATRSIPKSLLVAAIFAVHPLNVETVAWAAELKNLLCTFFFLLTIGAYGWYARKPGAGRYLAVFVLFLLGLASKPMVVTLPFVLLLVDFWPLGRIERFTMPSPTFAVPQRSVLVLFLEKLPLFALSAASAWVTVFAQRYWKATEVLHAPLGARLANATVSCATYFAETLFPLRLALYIPFPLGGTPLWKLVLSVVFLLAATIFVLRYARTKPYLPFGWLYFLGTLVPVLGIMQVGAQARADRYMYLPMIGLLCALVWGISEFADAQSIAIRTRLIGAAAVLAFFSVITVQQVSYWRSSYDLWTHSIAITKVNPVAERNLSAELIRTGRMDEAFSHTVRAVELDPTDYISRFNLGAAYSFQGKEREAVAEYSIVMEKSTDERILLSTSLNAGRSYGVLGDWDRAESAYRFALTLAPNNATALRGLDTIQKTRYSQESR